MGRSPVCIITGGSEGIGRRLANEFAEYLRQKGCSTTAGNASDYDYEKTVIIDRGRRDKKSIKKLCDFLGVDDDQVLLIRSQDVESEVTMIIGADYSNLKAFKEMHPF